MVFNEQLNMSEPNSPFIAGATSAPNQQTTVMNNGNPNNGSGGPGLMMDGSGSVGVITGSTPSIGGSPLIQTTPSNVNASNKGQRYAPSSSSGSNNVDVGNSGMPVTTKPSPGTGKGAGQRTGRGSKNVTPKAERR